MDILEKIRTISSKPGVYVMKDAGGGIIYIGKAKNLRKRVSSYFHKRPDLPRLAALVQGVSDIETVITDNEVEALILESNLIRKHKPRFNIELKDNQKYPYIKITDEPYPRIVKTRIRTDDSSLYFGPYPNVKYINRTIRTITDIFPIIRCKRSFGAKTGGGKETGARGLGVRGSVCMAYYLGKCVCPYVHEVPREEYARLVDQVVLFLKGRNADLLKNIKKEMLLESREKKFERAIQLRDRYNAVEAILGDQKITSLKGENEDIVGIAAAGDRCCVTVLSRRDGKIIGKRDFLLGSGTGEQDVVEQFLVLYYQDPASLPDAVLLPFPIENPDTLRDFFQSVHGKEVEVTAPQKGQKRRLVEMAGKNASQKLREELFRYDPQKAGDALKARLGLERAPAVIEAFDISTTLGALSVASMVRFYGGLPDRKGYRRFRIRYAEGQNDVEMIKEAVGRRYQRLLNEGKPLPDLVLIDGGDPQVNGAKEVLDSLGAGGLAVIGLAKRQEEIHVPGAKEAVVLEKNDDALRVLMAVRNEAHRFANAYHLRLRGKEALMSRLMAVPGIGEERAKSILSTIEDLSRVPSREELRSIKGIGEKRAGLIREILQDGTVQNTQ